MLLCIRVVNVKEMCSDQFIGVLLTEDFKLIFLPVGALQKHPSPHVQADKNVVFCLNI